MVLEDSGFQLMNPEYYKKILIQCSVEKKNISKFQIFFPCERLKKEKKYYHSNFFWQYLTDKTTLPFCYVKRI